MKKWTRRSLVAGGVLVALPIVGVGLGKLWCSRKTVWNYTTNSLLKLIYPDSRSAKVLGSMYIKIAASSAADALVRLQKQHLIASAVDTGCLAETMTAVEIACRNDFQEGRTYCVDGWIMAQTELDIAAVYTMDA